MFNKKCDKCNRKIQKDFEFCPYCGRDFRIARRLEDKENFGMLGKDDFLDSAPNFNVKMPFGLDNLFNSLVNELNKEMQGMEKEMKKPDKKSSGISISISTADGKKPEVKVKAYGPGFQPIKEAKIENTLSEEDAKKMSKMQKKEAETRVRRLSNKIIYELDLPGVTEVKNILISKLENSIEIKALGENKAYYKLIPLNLPILDYKLKDEKLTIEFQPK